MIFVDTNYYLRLLIKDNVEQHKKVKSFFEKSLNEKVKLFSSVIVFFEVFWVLTSFYGKEKKQVVRILKNLLKMDFIDWEDKSILWGALIIYSSNNVDFEDSYNLSKANDLKVKEFKTFDKKLLKVWQEVRS